MAVERKAKAPRKPRKAPIQAVAPVDLKREAYEKMRGAFCGGEIPFEQIARQYQIDRGWIAG